jgi:hypothetical protein
MGSRRLLGRRARSQAARRSSSGLDCRFLSARSYRQRCLIDVLLVSALISILVVLAFTDWGVLAYVLPGLVFDVDRVPTRAELAEAVRRSGLSILRLDLPLADPPR